MNKTSYTILHVDDDIDDVLIIREIFQQHTDKVTIKHAGDGVQALQTLKQMHNSNHLPCLIILDINMPRMDGKTALRHIKADKAFHNIPIVLFSTSDSKEDQKFAKQWGADLVTKPITYQRLEKVVDDFIELCSLSVAAIGS